MSRVYPWSGWRNLVSNGRARLGEVEARVLGRSPAAVARPTGALVEGLGSPVAVEHPQDRLAVAALAHGRERRVDQRPARAFAERVGMRVESRDAGDVVGLVRLGRRELERAERLDLAVALGDQRELARGARGQPPLPIALAAVDRERVENLVGHQAAVGGMPGGDVDGTDRARVGDGRPAGAWCAAQRAEARRRWVTASIVTAASSTAPVIMNLTSESSASRSMPFEIEPITTAPSSADQM